MRVALLLALVIAGCGGPEKPPVVAHQTAKDRLLRVGTVWVEDSRDEGILQGDPNGITSFHVHTVLRVTMRPDGTASEDITRDERFQLQSGHEYACKVKGIVQASVAFAWEGEEARVVLHTSEAQLPRACEKAGFPVPVKRITEASTTFALRSDQLVAVDPQGIHDIFVPAQ